VDSWWATCSTTGHADAINYGIFEAFEAGEMGLGLRQLQRVVKTTLPLHLSTIRFF